MNTSEKSASVIVMEYGSLWPSHIPRTPEAASLTTIIQQPDEGATRLKHRAIRRVASLADRGAELQSAVLACGNTEDEETWTSRALIAKAMLASIRRVGRGRLIFAAHQSMSPASRLALFALAGALTSLLAGTDVSVGVTFA